MTDIIKNALAKAQSYTEYRSMIDDLLANNKTTGTNHSEAMIGYTKLNASRMKRLDKTTRPTEEVIAAIEKIDRPMTWLVITEGWCGDAAQSVPVVQKLSELNDKVTTKYVLRDENEDLINEFLTNGGKSIPVFILIDEQKDEVIGRWGPRPAEMQAMVMERKNSENPIPYEEFNVQIQKWYAKDKTQSIQREFLGALQKAEVL